VIVVDASALVELVSARPPPLRLTARLLGSNDLHAPHLVDVEATHGLGRLVMSGELTAERASDARVDLSELKITRYAHHHLLARAWELRHTVSTYDAVYVSLAELLPAPLVTCDARLAGSTGHDAEIELYEPDA